MKRVRPRVAYIVSHPIQYQVPLLRKIASAGIELDVFFLSDYSVHVHRDKEFCCDIKWDVDLLTGYRHTMLADNQRAPPGFFCGNPTKVMWRILRGDFDVVWVHGWAYFVIIAVLLSAKLRRIPVLLRGEARLCPERQTSIAWQMLYRALVSCGTGYLYIGSENRLFYEAYGAEVRRLFAMPYCVDNDFFQSQCRELAPRKSEIKRSLGLNNEERPVILYSGKLTRRKQGNCLLQAYARLQGIIAPESCPYLLFVGDGELRKSLQEEVSAKGLEHVHFFGFKNQRELCDFYSICDVFVLASEAEPWGLAVNEVMNFGKPVIVSDQVGAAADLVRLRDTGFIVKAGDPEELCRALAQVIEPGVGTRLGRNAFLRITDWSFNEDIAGLRAAIRALT